MAPPGRRAWVAYGRSAQLNSARRHRPRVTSVTRGAVQAEVSRRGGQPARKTAGAEVSREAAGWMSAPVAARWRARPPRAGGRRGRQLKHRNPRGKARRPRRKPPGQGPRGLPLVGCAGPGTGVSTPLTVDDREGELLGAASARRGVVGGVAAVGDQPLVGA